MIRATVIAAVLISLAACSGGNRPAPAVPPEFLAHTEAKEAVFLAKSVPGAPAPQGGPASADAGRAGTVPVWHVRQGQTLSEVVRDWGSQANRTVVWQTNHDWPIVVSDQYRGTFDAALAWVLAGVADANPRPRAQHFANSSVRILSEE